MARSAFIIRREDLAGRMQTQLYLMQSQKAADTFREMPVGLDGPFSHVAGIIRRTLQMPASHTLNIRDSMDLATDILIELLNRTRMITVNEERTLAYIAILRMLGMRAFYAALHLRTAYPKIKVPIPAVAVASEPLWTVVIPVLRRADQEEARGLVSAVEILDDAALQSILHILQAADKLGHLRRDMGERDGLFRGEGILRAIDIGHLLFEGTEMWSIDGSAAGAMAAMGIACMTGRGRIMSVREIVEMYIVQNIIDGEERVETAMAEMLNEETRQEIMWAMGRVFERGDVSSQGLSLMDALAEKHECIRQMVVYLKAADEIPKHMHAAAECEYLRKMALPNRMRPMA